MAITTKFHLKVILSKIKIKIIIGIVITLLGLGTLCRGLRI